MREGVSIGIEGIVLFADVAKVKAGKQRMDVEQFIDFCYDIFLKRGYTYEAEAHSHDSCIVPSFPSVCICA